MSADLVEGVTLAAVGAADQGISHVVQLLLHVVDELLGKVTPEVTRGAPEVAPEVLLLPVAVVGAARPLEDGVAPLTLEVGLDARGVVGLQFEHLVGVLALEAVDELIS